MAILRTGNTMERITDGLSALTVNVKLYNSRSRTDINADAEDFYCGLLNIVLGKNLSNLNALQMDFPSIDLADRAARLCVQVTSTEGREKVSHTLEKFYERDMEREFDRLLILVIGEKKRFAKAFPGKGTFRFDPTEDIWDTAKLLAQIEGLGPAKRDEVDKYLQKHLSVYRREREPLLDLPMGSGMKSRDFVGRQEELRRIGEELAREGVAFLSGLGGMGKTELALRYGQNYQDAGRGLVYFVRFTGSLRRTVVENIAPNIPGFSRDGLNEEQIYAGAMAVLRKCDAGDLLILDNADDARESVDELRRELSRLPIRVLVTTRAEDDGAISVGRLENETLYGIFRNHRVDLPEPDMDELIAAVDGHTLTVDLMARLLRRERRTNTYNDLRDALTKKNLENADLGTVGTAYASTEGQARINEHLKTVFHVAKLGEAERTLLRFASLLPDCGLDVEIFSNAAVQKSWGVLDIFRRNRKSIKKLDTPRKVLDVLQALADSGWLLWEGDVLKIHPVICIVCREELKPTEKSCWSFIKGVCDWYDEKKYDHVKFRQIAELLEGASDTLGDPDGWYIHEAGYLWSQLGKSQQALKCNLRAVELLEQNQPDSNNLATAYNNVSTTYGKLGDHKKALEYQRKALAICEEVLSLEHPDLAISYNNVGLVYGDLGDRDKALEYLLKALAIREKVLPPEHLDIAQSYNNVGSTYDDLGDHHRALECHMKALAIREKVLLPEHPDIAQSYNNVGLTYGKLGIHEKALEYKLKALAICERVLPPEHPYLATSYNNVGSTYGALSDQVKALEYQMKALTIREKILPPEHPELAASYNNVGTTYDNLGDHSKALEYKLKALAIWEKVLLPTHPSLAISCNNLAWTHYKMGEYETSLDYMRRAADIAERSLPEGHPKRVDYQASLEWLERELRQRQGEE